MQKGWIDRPTWQSTLWMKPDGKDTQLNSTQKVFYCHIFTYTTLWFIARNMYVTMRDEEAQLIGPSVFHITL